MFPFRKKCYNEYTIVQVSQGRSAHASRLRGEVVPNMTVYESISSMIAFAVLVVAILSMKKD